VARKKRDDYTYRSMRDEREYGFYWYSGLWRVLRPILVVTAALVVVIGLVMTLWNKVYDEYLAPVDTTNTTAVTFTVESGQSLSRVATNLEKAELVRSKTVFKYYCDFAGMGQKIQSGTYTLNQSMTMQEIADQLTKGDGNPLVRTITYIPGWTIEEFAAKLVSDGVLSDSTEFLNLCKTGEQFKDYYYIADVLATSNVSQRKYVLEGYLAANTYEIYTTATAEEIIRKLLSQTDDVFSSEMQTRADELGMTMDEVLTLASLIEKEAKESDFTKVSAVFHNRLNQKIKLGSDVTIHYITGVRKMNLSSDDLKVQSLYNTYLHEGLPLGPICTPSEAAINAALYPDETYVAENYLYFCAKDPESGELYFSKTQAEHDQAVAIYSPLWEAYDESRGIE
jgi:UPF0755 protein